MKLALVGEGIAQSKSPDLHRRLGAWLNVPTEYDLVDALQQPDFDFAQAVHHLKDQGYRGTNVTFPFKEKAMGLADDISAGARLVGSSNTLVFTQQGIRAENTDYSGFIRSYRAAFGAEKPGKVLLLGAGGVGRAVAFALGALQVTALDIVERDATRGHALCADLQAEGIVAELRPPEAAEAELAAYQGVVNCTPVGHINHPGCPIATAALHRGQWVFDAVYIPAWTELLIAAERAGARLLFGVDLFVYQGVDAFAIFAGERTHSPTLENRVPDLRAHYFTELIGAATKRA